MFNSNFCEILPEIVLFCAFVFPGIKTMLFRHLICVALDCRSFSEDYVGGNPAYLANEKPLPKECTNTPPNSPYSKTDMIFVFNDH